ncbi:MAG: cytochrome c maturation protein CcmE [Casimicrobiaceae bacterium]
MKPRHRRIVWIVAGLGALGVAVALVLNAFQSNLVFFYTPTQIANGEAPKNKNFRIGGMVEDHSMQRGGELGVSFVVTDCARAVSVRYSGILPDMFKEGRGVVAQGHLGEDGNFVATEVLAKHDENYMPPEAAAALAKSGKPACGGAPIKQVQAAK